MKKWETETRLVRQVEETRGRREGEGGKEEGRKKEQF